MHDEAGMGLALEPSAVVDTLPGWFHFGFRRGSAQAVEGLARMTAEGGAPMAIEREPGYVTFRWRHPDGYQLEFDWEP
jgi:hypothetical protein